MSIKDRKIAKKAWDAIKTLCQGVDRVKKGRVQSLRTEFESLTMKDSDVIDDFYMKLNDLVTNIRALGEHMQESYFVKKLFRAMPSKFCKSPLRWRNSVILRR